MQKFYADKSSPTEFANGAIGYSSGNSFDCLGPFAKVVNCPIAGTDFRRTAYATSYPDTYLSVPACTRYKGKYIGGFFTSTDGNVIFTPYVKYETRLTN